MEVHEISAKKVETGKQQTGKAKQTIKAFWKDKILNQ